MRELIIWRTRMAVKWKRRGREVREVVKLITLGI